MASIGSSKCLINIRSTDKPTLYLVDWRGYLMVNDKYKDSEIMFEHLSWKEIGYDTYYVNDDFGKVKFLANLHGWTVQLRKISKKEIEEQSEDELG